MTQWLAFFAVVAVLTLALLVLARRSQDLIEESATQAEQSPATEERVAETPVDGQTVPTAATDDDQNGVTTETTLGDHDGQVSEQHAVGGVSRSPANAEVRLPQEQPQQTLELTSGALLANIAVTQGLVVVILLAAGWYFEIPARAFGVTGEPSSIGLPAVALGVAFGVVLWVGNEASTTLADAVGAAYDESVRELIAPDSPGGWLLLFAVILPIIAIAEELLFRAALIGVPAAGFGLSPWLFAVVSSLAFALGHGAQGRVGVVVTGLLGFVLAAGYILSGSLLLVVVAHYMINGMEFFVHEYLGVESVIP